MRADVSGFAKIAGARISRWHYITRFHQDPVRHTVVNMTAVVVGVGRERSSERIDPCARADAVLVAVQPRHVRVGTARTEMAARLAATGVTSAANGVFQRQEGVFHP